MIEVVEENLSLRLIFHYKTHVDWTRIEHGTPAIDTERILVENNVKIPGEIQNGHPLIQTVSPSYPTCSVPTFLHVSTV
jgi:hypothetical protein